MTKKQFITIINELKDYDRKIHELMDINVSLAMGVVEKYDLKETVIKSLEYAMNVNVDPRFGSDISWWIYETDYGEHTNKVWVHEKEYAIRTAEDLYDFIKGDLK